MKYLSFLFSSLILSSAMQIQAAPEKHQNSGPELLAPFSAASTLKEDFTCYHGAYANYDNWQAIISKKQTYNAKVFEKMFPKEDIERRQKNIECRIFVYESDGILVEGVMLQPTKSADTSGKFPVIIYNRGGNAKMSRLNFGAIQSNLMPLAEQGYIVIASQYRGAAGWSASASRNIKLDEYGGADVNDVVNLLPIITGMPAADSTRVAMIGSSRGSIMSYQAAVRMPQLKALIIKSGWSDLEVALETRPDMKVYDEFIPDYANNKAAELAKRSVLRWLDKLPQQLPVLLLHGEKDVRIHVTQARNMAQALEKRQQPYKYVEFSGADHYLMPNRAEADAETAAWLKQYL